MKPLQIKKEQYKGLQGQMIICSIQKQNRKQLNFNTTINGIQYVAYLKKQNTNYLPGDTLQIQRFNISLIKEENKNDYTTYLLSKGIKGQIFLNQHNVLEVKSSQGLLRTAYMIRQNIIQKIQEEKVLSPSEEGIFYSLLLGDRSYLDKEIKEDFKESGIIHVLAISGLHVGILFVFIQKFLKLIGVHNRHFKLIFVVLILLFYAIIAGLSPSVVRAALMCCLIQIGSFLQEKNIILNIVLSSALFLLLFRPQWIWDLGFLLSYFAVIFIVITLNRFKEHFDKTTHPILKKLGQLTLVNFAAFSGTSPLLIYNFGTVYFGSILCSLVIVPLVSILVMLGLSTLLFTPIKSIFHLLLLLNKYIIQVLNQAASMFSEWLSFPCTFEISVIQCILMYLFLVTTLSKQIKLVNKLKAFAIIISCFMVSIF